MNVVANLGTARDKAANSVYVQPLQDDNQLAAMYRGSAIARKIVDMPAEDAMREWREWQASAEQISSLEAEEMRLGIKSKLIEAYKKARLFGGAAVYIGTKDIDLSKPLDPERIGQGGLQYLTVLPRHELTPKEIERDPREDNFNRPKMYRMSTGSTTLDVHPTRLVIFPGEELPDSRFASIFNGWGDSVLMPCIDPVTNLDATMANIASLVFEAKVDVLGVPNLMDKLRDGGTTYESLLLRRATLAATGKGINGTLITDAEETYSQKSANFSTLPQIATTFMQMTSAAANIPMTLLFGMSPSGLNATGDADTRGYYDAIKVLQTMEIQPALAVLDECLVRSALGNRPDEVHYNWRPLWQPTTKERADTGKVIADTFKVVRDMDILPDEALGTALVNGLTESGLAPGLEGDVNEFFEGSGEEGDDVGISDAKPETLYVRRDVLNGSAIVEWAKTQGFETTLPADDLHVTIMFSRRPVDWMKMGESWQSDMTVNAGGARIMEKFGEARVLLFNSSELSWRHEQMKREGATWDHEEYQPHITISYDPDAPDLDQIEPYRGEIILGPEIFEKVNEKWLEGIKET